MIAAARTVVLTGSKRREWEKSVIGDSRLTKSTDVFLMTVILGYCRGKSECWPTTKTLAKHMRMSDRSIQSAIKRCVKAEVLALEEDSRRASSRRFVVLSHPSLAQDDGENNDQDCGEKRDEKRCVNCAPTPKNLRTKAEFKTEYSSSSSLRSEESSSKSRGETTTTDLPRELVQEISRTLPEHDVRAILVEGRVIAKKALGKWDLISKAIQYIKRHRDSIKGVVPYLVKLLDSWAIQGVPPHVLDLLIPRIETQVETLRVVVLSPEKRKRWEDYYAAQRAKNRPVAGLS